ncbi:TonB-dependent receptor plug domain-containing protein, partial [Methylomonas koyamae]
MNKLPPFLLLLPASLLHAETQTDARLDEIVVTAPLPVSKSDAGSPVTVLSDDELRMKTGHSIGDTLKNELGISSQSFGPGVGTPVIRGQAGPRVRVLSNGIGANDVSSIS